MRGLLITLAIVIGIGALAYFTIVPTYNKIQISDNECDAAWAEVQTQYQRRFDLIDNLVETVKQSANFERGTLTDVTEARSKAWGAIQSSDGRDLSKVNESLNGIAVATGRRGMGGYMMGYQEKYPDLKSTKAFQDLMVQLEGTENRVSKARSDFNGVVKEHNNLVEVVPAVWIANMFNKGERDVFEAVDGAEVSPSVRDSYNNN